MRMSRILIPLAAATCFAVAVSARAATPTAEQIVAKWIDAVGGKSAIESIRTREAKGTMKITAIGLESDVTYLGKAPDKRLVEFTFLGFGKAREGYDGQKAWAANPGAPITTKTGKELARARREASFHQELNFTQLYPVLSVEGATTVGGREAWILKATPAEGDSELHYFDQETGLLLRKDVTVETPQGVMKAEVLFEDYRKVDGVNIAHTIRMPEPGSVAFVMTFTEVRHNIPIPDDRFKQPAQ